VVSDLDEATQRNAVLAAQADRASGSLQSVSSRLAQTVSEFTTG
jgi:methyl-accepting chemotaxis protein